MGQAIAVGSGRGKRAPKRCAKSRSASPPPAKRTRSSGAAESSCRAAERAARPAAPRPTRASAAASAPAAASPPRRQTRSAAPRTPPPLPYFASAADLLVAHFGTGYLIRDAATKALGRALFAARPFAAGELLARFSGEILHADGIPAHRSCSHMLRTPGSDAVIDGRKLARQLVPVPGEAGAWRPRVDADPRLGYACLANSAPKAQASAAVRFLCDDTAVRDKGFRPPPPGAPWGDAKLKRETVNCLPRAAYLVARRDLAEGEEITWNYQVALR